jgi:hypothetical protein
MRRAVCALALSFMALPSWAQNASPSPLALDLIANSNAEGVFESLASEQAIAVRHARSGLVCRMDASNANRLMIFPQAARGEDVACETSNGRETIRLFATRFSVSTTLDEQLAGAVRAIRANAPGAQELPMTQEIASDDLPPHRHAQFIVTRADGARLYTSVSVTMINGWVIKLRFTTPAADEDAERAAERAARATWSATLHDMAAAPTG